MEKGDPLLHDHSYFDKCASISLYHNTAGSRSEGDKQGEVPDTISTPDANENKPAEDGMLAIFLE